MTTFTNYIINLLKKKLDRTDIKAENLKVLNMGKFANAYVYRYRDLEQGINLTIKDFYHCPYPVRQTIGRFMPMIEHNTMKKLNGIKGIATEVFYLSPFTVAFSYVEGVPLKVCYKDKEKLPVEFFVELENSIREMHSRDIVHLDLRNFGNIIKGKDGKPYLIDFQSSISTKRLPKKAKTILENSDISGVYKAWDKLCEIPLPEEKVKFLEDFNALRKFWVLRGYPIQRAIRKIKKKIKNK